MDGCVPQVPAAFLSARDHRKLHLPKHSVPNSTGDFYIVMDYREPALSTHGSASVATHASVLANLTQMLPALLAAVWLCGFVAVLYTWLARWRRISSAMRAAVPVQEGREVDDVAQARAGRRHSHADQASALAQVRWSPASLASRVLCWSGRKEFLTAWKTPTLKPFSRTKSGMSAVATILPLSSTCWWKPSSGFTPWSGGLAPD